MTDVIMERAYVLFQQKRYAEAEKSILEVLAIEPGNIQCLLMLAEIKIDSDRIEEALSIVNDAIGLDPDFDPLYHTKARILLEKGQPDAALQVLSEALILDPYEPDYYALQGFILNTKKDFTAALEAANQALAIDASHILGLNVRSTALLKLNRKEDSFATIEEALEQDPNNANTHANYGWGLLEKGQNDKALVHFRESLKNNPNSDYAQAGMAEALKAKYFLYRWFLRYSFWMQNMTSKNQWVFIIGFYLSTKGLRALANTNQVLDTYLSPIIVLLAIFAFSTWVIGPLSNLLFRLNPYGKHLLTSTEIKCANWVGGSLLLLLIGLGILFLNMNLGTVLIAFGFSMMLPLGKLYAKPRLFFTSYAIGLALLGFASIAVVVATNELYSIFSTIYILAFIAFQWLSNFFIMRNN